MSDVIEAAAQRILARTGSHSSEDFGNYNEKDDPPLVARAYLAMLVAKAAPHGTVSVDEWCAALDETDAALAGRCCADAPAPAEDGEGLRKALVETAIDAAVGWASNEHQGDIDVLGLAQAIRAALSSGRDGKR